MMKHRSKGWVVAGLCMAMGLLAGCGGNTATSLLPDPTVLFVNGSRDAGNLRLLLNNVDFSGSIAPGAAMANFTATEFIATADEAYDVVTASDDLSEQFDAEEQEFARNTHTIVAAIGQRNFVAGEEIKRLRQVLIPVDRNALGGSTVRIIALQGFNRQAGSFTPNVTLQTPGDNPTYAIRDLAFGETGTLDIAAGTNTWQIKRSDGESVYGTATVNLTGGIYLALLSGTEGAATPAEGPQITFIRLNTL
ncbi:MAG TPA: hypothetical protein PLB31_08070 [Fimbriimonadaceae bacterium]|nr:hypothetical protein [Armatimonadota bacterium]HCM73761.1 hypothetical protein [Armatimonadota bacterium]HRD30143.1 hypothetical protein [Fimbriimonadaceae bacterium]HRE94430.1 hypothetical protein [Fimbriimonadaceae bacterium]HRI74413.1 hypothetical protein [Fimbriimonadaceae bacterium]